MIEKNKNFMGTSDISVHIIRERRSIMCKYTLVLAKVVFPHAKVRYIVSMIDK